MDTTNRLTLADIMSRNAKSLAPSDTVRTAAEMMRENNIGAIPVVDAGRLVGIITDRDLVLRALAEGMDAGAPIGPISSTDVVCGSTEMSVPDAASLMSQKQIRRLPVVDGTRLVGIVSIQDVAQNADTGLVGQVVEAITEES